jgi:ubiquinone/menaquinone biosynthesis C-methylase UbiE
MSRPDERERRIVEWDRRAACYEASTAGLERRFLFASRRWVCERATGQTLEVAVGTGLNLPCYGPDVELTGIEWSPAMLRLAAARARELGRDADLRVGDAMSLPFPDGAFDSVVCTYALCCIRDERAALAEMVRVLRPGGHVLLADHVASSLVPLRLLQGLLDLATVPLQGEHYRRRPIATLRTLDVSIVASERLHLGVIERVHARRR